MHVPVTASSKHGATAEVADAIMRTLAHSRVKTTLKAPDPVERWARTIPGGLAAGHTG